MFVLETDFLRLWRDPAGPAELYFALIEPALIGRGMVHVLRRAHLVVEVELFHEAVVGFAEGTCFADLRQGFVCGDAVSLHQVRCGRPMASVTLRVHPTWRCRNSPHTTVADRDFPIALLHRRLAKWCRTCLLEMGVSTTNRSRGIATVKAVKHARSKEVSSRRHANALPRHKSKRMGVKWATMTRMKPGQNLPVHEHARARIQPILYEAVARREVLEEIVVVDVVDLDDLVGVAGEEAVVQGQSQNGEDTRDVRVSQGRLPAQSEETSQGIRM